MTPQSHAVHTATMRTGANAVSLGFRSAHLIGIAGAGMRALAKALLAQGVAVSGSDTASPEKCRDLIEAGARVFQGHADGIVGDAEVVVYSSAIAQSNPELKEAERRGIAVLHRADMLALFLETRPTILVAGTHGKTTTTTLLSLILEAAGEDPWAFVGGEVAEFGGNVRCGGVTWCVAEADESDGTFLRLPGAHGIVTNVEAEHLNFWETEEKMFEGFATYCERFRSGNLVLCADQLGTRQLRARLAGQPTLTYSTLPHGGDFWVDDVELLGRSSRFRFHRGDEPIGHFELGVPGLHNVANATGALALAASLGVDVTRAAQALALFRGVGRRFTCYDLPGGIALIDDYAHHVSEVEATIKAADLYRRERGGRLIAVFQPHRYSRTQQFWDRYPKAFDGVEKLYITEIYAASEAPVEGIDGMNLAAHIRDNGGPRARYIGDSAAAISEARAEATEGDIVLLLGAGNITDAAKRLVAAEGGRRT